MDNASGIIFILITLVISIPCHEFMHGYVADALGDDTARLSGRLSLNPLRHIDPFTTVLLPIILFISGLPIFAAAKPVPFNPYRLRYGEVGAAFVAVAGPLTNFFLALVASLWLRLGFVESVLSDFFVIFIALNVGLFVFNLIPFPPLDGSRVLYAIVPEPMRQLMRQIENMGFVGIALFIFLLFPFIRPLMGGIMNALLRLLIPGFDLGQV